MSFVEGPFPPKPESLAPDVVSAVEPMLSPAPVEDPPWTLWAVGRIVLVAIIAIGLFSLVAMGLAMRTPGSSPADLARNARVVVPPQIAAYIVVIAYMVWLVRSRRRPFWGTISWRWPGAAWFGWVALGLALALIVQGLSALLPIPKSLPIDRYFRDTVGAYEMAVFGMTFAPLMEELFFRGFLYPALARRLGVTLAIVLTAVLFAFIHASQLAHAWAPLLLLFFVGVVLTGVRARTGSVATTFLIHVGYNGTLFGMLYVASGHFRHFERLS